jgi:hypothetical protein
MSTGRLQVLACHVMLVLVSAFATSAWADDWIDVIVRALGISKTPSQLRAPGDELKAGNIYVVSISGKAPVRVTRDGDYRSPIFLLNDNDLLAFKGEDLIKLPLAGGSSKKLHTVPQALKLLGLNRSDPDQVLYLLEDTEGRAQVGSLSLKDGRITRLPYNPQSPDQRRMMSNLRGDDREYDGISLYLKSETKAEVTGPLEWTDVYVKQSNRPPVNVSNCDGSQCSQPSLSHDGQRVAFIRSDPIR